ncbi:hypothetical protein [Oceanobacillus sp. Castelsardo]|uniref:hypothetical protein n=1 Tax=Oceanobacillus sp. Castelsardo TaxID=1851204 RepID=UPI0012E988D6|nr:hypothetical protein [Oceanobacillus sp. Castelsardo]
MNQTLDDYKKSFVIEQLRKYNYHDTDEKDYKELVNQLARLRAMEVEVKSPHSDWF